jgi:hypothetical protein
MQVKGKSIVILRIYFRRERERERERGGAFIVKE